MSLPSKGETYAELVEHLRMAQEKMAMLAHIAYSDQDHRLGQAWLQCEELAKRMIHSVTSLATKGLQ